jgi:guanylate kinase
MERGGSVVLEIEVQGARQVREAMPEAVTVFIAPPSAADLRRRLEGRGTDQPEEIERRLGEAGRELEAQGEFSHVVVNDDIGAASERLLSLVRRQLAT